MPRLHLAVLTTRNETWRSENSFPSFKTQISCLHLWSKLSILFTNKILRELDKKKLLFYKLSVQYMVVKPACVNAALVKRKNIVC